MKTCSSCSKVSIEEHYMWCNACENKYQMNKKRMADGLKTGLEQALEIEKSKTREDWVEIYEESIEELNPTKFEVPSGYYNSTALKELGIKCGKRCMIHKENIIINHDKLVLGDNVRIDAYCTISCGIGITIGSNVHIAGYVSLFGGAGIDVGDYASIASGSKIFSVSDDVNGKGLVGPTVPMEKRHLHSGRVIMGPYSVMAINSAMMPGSWLSLGSTLMPYSIYMVKTPKHKYAVYAGVPADYIKDKHGKLQELVEELEDEDT